MTQFKESKVCIKIQEELNESMSKLKLHRASIAAMTGEFPAIMICC